MKSRRPETLALLVALIGSLIVLAAFVVNLVLSRERELDSAGLRLQQTANLVADHTSRALDAVDIVLRDMAAELTGSQRDWHSWDAGRGWEFISRHHSKSLPQLGALWILDQQGELRHASSVFPVPQINEKDQPFFQALADGAPVVTYGPFVGRNSDRYSFGIARRLVDPLGQFAGIALAQLEPGYFTDFCWANRSVDDFEAILVNSRHQILASCRPVDPTQQASFLGSDAVATLAGGALRGNWPELGLTNVTGYQIAAVALPNYPELQVIASLPETTVLAPWSRRALELGIFAGLATAVLLSGGWLVRRQVAEQSQLTAALDENRRELEERIREATAELAFKKEEAERASTAKSRFLAAASHDLRQPLHALSLFAADLQRQVKSGNTGGLERVSEQIAASTSVLGELLDSLLDVSRLDVAGIRTESAPFAVQSVFQRLADSYRRPAQAKKLTLRFRPTDRHVFSDITLVERLLANLISNAIRYTPEGGRVLVAARRRGDQLRIEVRDSGIGIAPEHQAAIFAEFYQVGNTAREQSKGLGLGLSIVDRLAHALNTPISLCSQPGAGTTFSVTLPLCPPPTPMETQSLRPGQRPELLAVGSDEALSAALRLASGWGWDTRWTDIESCLSGVPSTAVIIADFPAATTLAVVLPGLHPLIAITDGHQAAPVGSYVLAAPIRPAKLRALLEQLQKTASRSTA